MDLFMTKGNTVAGFRRNYCMTQDDLAKEVGVTKRTIGNIENGRHMISRKTRDRLCQVFGATVQALFPPRRLGKYRFQ